MRSIWKYHRSEIIYTAAGTIIGYLVLHPYAMLVYLVTHPGLPSPVHLHWDELVTRASSAFMPFMPYMATAFALFGGTMGLLTGTAVARKRKLLAAEYENQKSRIALDTIHSLMMTLSHYLLNANMIIGGQVRHCQKAASDQDTIAAMHIIEEQGIKIDAVIAALRRITEVKTTSYSSGSEITMIDIAREVEDALKADGKAARQSAPQTEP